jgi:hypothetical protein
LHYTHCINADDQVGLETNFSGLVGLEWPNSIKDTDLYTKVVICSEASTYPEISSSSCDYTTDLYPYAVNVSIKMDAEVFGRQFILKLRLTSTTLCTHVGVYFRV